MIPYGKQSIDEKDIEVVVETLKSNWLTQGPMVPAFENKLKNKLGAEYAVAVNSATSALHIACLALELGFGDILWTSPISFVASANAALYCGAQVDFVDIDPNTYNMCPLLLEKKLIQASKHGRLPKIVMPVHLSGQSCDMEKIFNLSKKYNFKIIEDASHAVGGKYKDEYIGSCRHSDIVVLSFHPVKIITTGEGGMALTNQRHLDEKLKLYRSHGITRDESLMQNPIHGSWYYEQIHLGYNYRMTEMQAALGVTQLDKLDDFINKRHKLADNYNQLLKKLPIILPFQNHLCFSSYHLYIIQLKLDKLSLSHRDFFEKMKEAGIGVNLHYIPIYLQPYYKKIGFSKNYCPNANAYYASAISLPMFPGLKETEQKYIAKTIEDICTL